MKISKRQFNRILRSDYVPHYANIKIDPKDLFNYADCSSYTLSRKIKKGVYEEEDIVRVSKDLQKDIYNQLCNLENIRPYIIGISSYPNDHLAMMTASLINFSLVNKFEDINVKWVNSSFKIKELNIDPDVVIIHNILPIKERLYQIRDIITRFPKALRLVVVGNMNALKFFDEMLCCPVSGTIHLDRVIKRLPSYQFYNKSPDTEIYIDKDITNILKPIAKKYFSKIKNKK